MLQKSNASPPSLSSALHHEYLAFLERLIPDRLTPTGLTLDHVYLTLCYLGEAEFWKLYSEVIFRRHLYPGLHRIFSDPQHEFWRRFIKAHYSENDFPAQRLSPLARLIYWRLEGQRKIVQPVVGVLHQGLERQCDFAKIQPEFTFTAYYNHYAVHHFYRLPLAPSLYLSLRRKGWDTENFALYEPWPDPRQETPHRKALVLLAYAAQNHDDLALYERAGWFAPLAADFDVQLAKCLLLNENERIATLRRLYHENVNNPEFRETAGRVILFAAKQKYNAFFEGIDFHALATNNDLDINIEGEFSFSHLIRVAMETGNDWLYERCISLVPPSSLSVLSNAIVYSYQIIYGYPITRALPQDNFAASFTDAMRFYQHQTVMALLRQFHTQLTDVEYKVILKMAIKRQDDQLVAELIRHYPAYIPPPPPAPPPQTPEEVYRIFSTPEARRAIQISIAENFFETLPTGELNESSTELEFLIKGGYGEHAARLIQKGYGQAIQPFSHAAYQLLFEALSRGDQAATAALYDNKLVLRRLNERDQGGNNIFDHLFQLPNQHDFALLRFFLRDPVCNLQYVHPQSGETFAHRLARFPAFDDPLVEQTLREVFQRSDFKFDVVDSEGFLPLHRAIMSGNATWLKIYCETQKIQPTTELEKVVRDAEKNYSIITPEHIFSCVAQALRIEPNNSILIRLGVTKFEERYKNVPFHSFSSHGRISLSSLARHLATEEQASLRHIENALNEIAQQEKIDSDSYTMLFNYLSYKTLRWPDVVTHPVLATALGVVLGVTLACVTAALLFFTFGVAPLIIAGVAAGTGLSSGTLTGVGFWKLYRATDIHQLPDQFATEFGSRVQTETPSISVTPIEKG